MNIDLSLIFGILGAAAVFGPAEYLYQTNKVTSGKSVCASVIAMPVTFLHEGAHLAVAEMLGSRVQRACLRLNTDFGSVNGAYVEALWNSKSVRTLSALAPLLLLLPLAIWMLLAQPFTAGWMNGAVAVVALLATCLSEQDKLQAKGGIRALALGFASVSSLALATWAVLSAVVPTSSVSMATVLAKFF